MTATGQTKINSLLQRHYRNSQWLTAIDDGVMYRTGEEPTLFSALSCYNSQLGKKFHIGAVSALEMQGLAHYVPLGRQTIVIYCLHDERNWRFHRKPEGIDLTRLHQKPPYLCGVRIYEGLGYRKKMQF